MSNTPAEDEKKGSYWSSFFSSVKNDFQELVSSVKSDAINAFEPISTNTKTVIHKISEKIVNENENSDQKNSSSDPKDDENQEKEEHPENVDSESNQDKEDAENGQNPPSKEPSENMRRLSNFLNFTKTKIVSLFNEDQDSSPESNEIIQIDDSEKISLIQSYDSTYTTIDKKEMEDYNQWLNQLSKPEMFKEASELLKTNSVIHYEFKKLVPNVITESTFWTNYFFHRHQIMNNPFHLHSPTKSKDVQETSQSTPSPSHSGENITPEEVDAIQSKELQELERGWGDDSDLDLDAIHSIETDSLSNDPTQDPIVPEVQHEEVSEEDPSVPPAQEVSPSLLTTESSSTPQYLNEKDTNALDEEELQWDDWE